MLQRELLEIGHGRRERLDQIRQRLAHIVAPTWESIARLHLLVAGAAGQMPFTVPEAGPWWSKKAQIDVVGINRAERKVVFAEAKWLHDNLTPAHLDGLIDRANHWLEGDTAWEVHYALFGRVTG